MCGIAGMVNLKEASPPERAALLRMVSALKHRGPDEFGAYCDARAALGHARLSIIDLASGQQPMANAQRTLWIVFNGEIFNHVELREELERLGYEFRTKSDTEVLIHAYEAWGHRAFDKLNGQWALALWEPRSARLTLSRDRVGVRPLFLCRHGERILFASEIKSIFAADGSIPRAIDARALDETFTFWSALPPRTIFEDIEELPPGVVRVYDKGECVETTYWTPYFPEHAAEYFADDVDVAAEAVASTLERATALRMLRADVPVGCYLSGGLDSSLIAALARGHVPGALKTFSLRFADAEYDETPFQRIMAERLGADHHELVVGRAEIAGCFPDVIFHAERPVLRTAPAPLFLLSRLVREQGIKAVLTGEGADEMFAGYDLFREAKVRRFWAKHPESTFRPRALERLYPYLRRSPVAQQALAQSFFGRDLAAHREPSFGHAPRWQATAALKRMFHSGVRQALHGHDPVQGFVRSLPTEFARWSELARDQYIEIRTLLSSYLLSAQGDRVLMANSVEGRFPFLDKDVVALACLLRPEHKLRVLDEKHVLKRVANELVPEAIIRRKKQPYRAPDALSFVQGRGLVGYAEELLSEQALRSAGLFDVQAVRALVQKCVARADTGELSNADNMALVGALSTQLLHHQYVRGRPRATDELPLVVDERSSRDSDAHGREYGSQ